MNSSQDVYSGNNAADYQPPTQNPQASTTDLQPGATGAQSSTGNDNITQQRLPNIDNLKVMILQDGAGSTNVHLNPVQAATQTWAGPFWGCVVLLIIGIIVWSVKVLAKEEAPHLAEALEEAVKEPLLADEAPVASITKPKKKTVQKKSPVKKPTKKKAKRK